jgi:hypothetical protein
MNGRCPIDVAMPGLNVVEAARTYGRQLLLRAQTLATQAPPKAAVRPKAKAKTVGSV